MAPSIENLAVDVELARRAYRNALHMACDRQDGEDNRTCLYLSRHQDPTYPGGVGTAPVWPKIEMCPRCILVSERRFELAQYQARLKRWVRKLAGGKIFGPGPLVIAEGVTRRKTWIASAGRRGALRMTMPNHVDLSWGWAEPGLVSDGSVWIWRNLEYEEFAKSLVLKTEPKRALLASGFAWQIVRPNAVLVGEAEGGGN